MSLIILSIGLSDNPQAKVVETDGSKFNQMSAEKGGRLYLVQKMIDDRNPNSGIKTRLVSQDFNSVTGEPVWKQPVEWLRKAVGKEIDGKFVREEVAPFQITSKRIVNGVLTEVTNTATRFGAVVFGDETVKQVFHNNGHRLVESVSKEGVVNYEPMSVLPARFQTGKAKPVSAEHEAEGDAPQEHAPEPMEKTIGG